MKGVWSLIKQTFSLFFWKILPLILLIIAFLLIIQASSSIYERYQYYQVIQDRLPHYAETATAISSEQDAVSFASNPYLINQIFVTNTPAADEMMPTEVPPPTAVPTIAEIEPTNIPEVPAEARTPVALPTLLLPPDVESVELSGTAVPPRVPAVARNYDLVNIILIGGDDEVTKDNFVRTDTMILVSINLNTGTVNMMNLPRDLFVYIPSGTMQRLNTAYGIGENIGWSGGGFELLRQTIFYNFGINIHYFAKVDFSGFESIINELGGVQISVDCDYQDYYPVDDIDPTRPLEENYYLRTLPVGYYLMDGFDALWYARTRRNSDDFDRGRRQQLLLRAIWDQVQSTSYLSLENLPNLWDQVTQIVETNITFDVALGLVPVALNLDSSKIDSFNVLRLYHTTPWQTPNGDYVQLPNPEQMTELFYSFYQPPTESQLNLAGPSILIHNGTDKDNLDKVAEGRLSWEGLNATAAGVSDATDNHQTRIIDHVAASKGSLIPDLTRILNVKLENIITEPDPNREYDYEIILGDDYNSCTYNVLPVDEP
ncbi:hypothetical protein MASR2M15_08440 [Anaerolineales bacterium]